MAIVGFLIVCPINRNTTDFEDLKSNNLSTVEREEIRVFMYWFVRTKLNMEIDDRNDLIDLVMIGSILLIEIK